jgi:hypothetical protein
MNTFDILSYVRTWRKIFPLLMEHTNRNSDIFVILYDSAEKITEIKYVTAGRKFVLLISNPYMPVCCLFL